MSKLIVSVNSFEQLRNINKKNVAGVILYLDKLSVNSNFYMTIDEIIDTNFNNLEVFVCLNKILHNSDLELVRICLNKLKDTNYMILFYDMAIYNIAREIGIVDKLIIYQDHLNLSSRSNNFYYNLGIMGSYISSDITGLELLNIRKKYQGKIMFTVYGYLPIFYSRRYLITNYLKYIGRNIDNKKYTIKGDNGEEFPICEEEYGTTIYSSKVVNLINKLDELKDIDYFVLNGNMIDYNIYDDMIDKFINKETMDNCYLGFYNTKTIYRVKGD